jgi:Xaa-Pro aminopeptidase
MSEAPLIREKVSQAVELLREFDIDCWLTFVRETAVTPDPMLAFLCESNLTWHTAFVITRKGRAAAIVGQLDAQSIRDLGVYEPVIDYVKGIRRHLLDLLAEFQPRTIAANYSQTSEVADGLSHGLYLTLMEYLGELGWQDRLISAEPVISGVRARKSARELERIRKAVAETEAIFEEARRFIRPGQTERQVARFIADRMRDRGLEPAWEPAQCPAVFTGPVTAEAHYAPTDRRIEPGHVLNMDFGVKVQGYCSDLQRTFYVREPGETGVPEAVARGFQTLVEAIECSRQAIRPGVTGREVDAAARGRLVRAGYEEYPHALGHQVGRVAHDGTAILGPAWEKYGSRPELPLEAGMVFTLEPRLKVPGRGTVTVEEMVVVTPEGTRYLSTPQREIWII